MSSDSLTGQAVRAQADDQQEAPRARDALQVAASNQSMLARLCRQANAYQRLGDQVRQLLPADVAEHCKVACIDNRDLVLIAPTSAWATRIRMLSKQIFEGLQANAETQERNIRDLGYDRIVVKVVPPTTDRAVPQQPRDLSPAARKALTGLAETTRNPELATVIRRTLRRANR